jgi:DNA adenine methylase
MKKTEKVKSPIKWVGGKSRLLSSIPTPASVKRYYEPFLGGGSMMLNLLKDNPRMEVHASDTNRYLINMWQIIQTMPNELIGLVDEIVDEYNNSYSHVQLEFYKTLKDLFSNRLIDDHHRLDYAASFLLLNRLCFNGLYRVNKKGCFNVPFNHSKKVKIDTDNILAVSKLIKNVEFSVEDFKYINFLADSFIFIDPPYTPASDTSNFVQYTADSSSMENILRRWMKLYKNDYKICLTNNAVYPWNIPIENYKSKILEIKRNISAKSDSRCISEEIVIYNF